MSLITGIAHVGIRVHNLEASRQFYELLGFQFVIGPVGPEPVAIMKHPAGVEINLVLNAAELSRTNVLMDVDVKHAGYTHIALRINSIDDARTLMQDNDIVITAGPNSYPGGARGLFVRDPDDNVVELYEPGH